ncbi:MAG: TetR/AcrR family transcriptional regulator [Candidatus Methylacidiphilales bacterium]|nr:TetR/AcrR family transcriptional regulator [Candidatus Methylacidiphilales bacterium]
MGRTSTARKRLLEAAIELMTETSYATVTVDAICEHAGVKKGSFYHFFSSKSDLAVCALEADTQERRPRLDAIFSPTVPPLDRIRTYCQLFYEKQAEAKAKSGHVPGCPLFSLGTEMCRQDPHIRRKVQECLDIRAKYLGSAIRDAAEEGLVPKSDTEMKAKSLLAYFEGVLTQARIHNDLSVVKELQYGALELIGAGRLPEQKAA